MKKGGVTRSFYVFYGSTDPTKAPLAVPVAAPYGRAELTKAVATVPIVGTPCLACMRIIRDTTRASMGGIMLYPLGNGTSPGMQCITFVCDAVCGEPAALLIRRRAVHALGPVGRCAWCTAKDCRNDVCKKHACRQCGRMSAAPFVPTKCGMCNATTTCSEECASAHKHVCVDDVD